MAEDSLQIKISLSANGVEKNIKNITTALEDMNKQAKNEEFSKFANGVSELGKAAQALNTISKTSEWAKEFGESLQAIAEYGAPAATAIRLIGDAASGLDKSGMVKFGNAIKQFSNFLPNLQDKDVKQFKTFAKNTRQGLEELGLFDSQTYGKGITDSVRKLKQVGDGLSAFRDGALGMRTVSANISGVPQALKEFTRLDPTQFDLIAQNMMKVAPAMQEMSKNGAQLNDAAKGVERLPNALGKYKKTDYLQENLEVLRGVLTRLSSTFTAFDKDQVKGFAPVVKALGALPQVLKPFEEESFSGATANIGSVLGGLSSGMANFTQSSTKFKTSVNAIFNLHKAIEMFKEMPEGATSAIKNIGKALSGLNESMKSLETSPVTNLKKLATGLRYLERMGGDEKLWGRISAGGERMKEFIKNVSDLPDNTVQKFGTIGTALEGIAQGYGKIGQAQKALNKAQNDPKSKKRAQQIVDIAEQMVKQTPKSIKKVAGGFGKLFSLPFKGTIDHVKNLSKTFESLRSRIARVALNRAIRQGLQLLMNAVKEGVKNLYQWSLLTGNNFVNTMNSLSSGFLYLKNSIGAAVSPLLDQLAPALNTVINLVVTLLNAINQLFSILGGAVTWRRAVRQQKDFAKAVGSGAGGAGDLADELERTVLAFDELNKLNDAKDKSGGGGGGSGADLDYGGMFETVPIDEELARILNSDNWFPLGTKISDWVADGLEKIDWKTIKDKANRVAGQLATMLNGIFANDRMWTDIGITIGEGINTATTFITKFVYETDWVKLGDDLANLLKTTFETINWEDVGKSLVSSFNIVMKMLHGFVDEMTWEDWDFIGTSIAEGINGAIESIQWENIVPDFFDLIAGILHAINTAIAKIDWHQAFSELWKGIREADWRWLWEEVITAIKNAMPIITIALTITFVKGAFTLGASIAKEAVAKWLAAKLVGITVPVSPTFTGSGTGTGGSGGGSKLASAGETLAGLAGIFATITALSDLSKIDWQNGDNTGKYATDFLGLILGGAGIGTKVGGPGMGTLMGATAAALAGDVAIKSKQLEQAMKFAEANKEDIDKYNKLYEAAALTNPQYTSELLNIHKYLSDPDNYVEARKQLVELASAWGINVSEILGENKTLIDDTKTTFQGGVPEAIEAGQKPINSHLQNTINSFKQSAILNKYGTNSGTAFAEGLKSTLPTITTTASEVAENARLALDKVEAVRELGVSTGQAYSVGVDSTKPTVQGVADGVASVVKAGLDISDKSKTWGIDLASAYASGAESTKPNVETVITGIGDAVKTGLDVGTKSRNWGSDTTGQYKTGLETNKTPISNSVDDLIRIIGLLNRSADAKTWGTAIPTNLSSGMDNKASLVSTSAGTLQGYLNGINLSGSSWTWGYHLSKNLADGINYGSSLVSTAATGVATGIATLLGHSIPKEGPLTAELEWMPHMMENLANGIRTNAWRVENEMSNVASSMVLPSSSFNIEDDAEYGLSSALNGLALDTSSETPIVVYIGEDKLDSVIAKSQGRMNVRSGGR